MVFGEYLPLRIVEAADDWRPLVRMLSLIAIGIPSSLDLGISNQHNRLSVGLFKRDLGITARNQ